MANDKTKVQNENGQTQPDTPSESMQLLADLQNHGFEDDEWIGRIGSVPSRIPLSVKAICFHNCDARGKPIKVNDEPVAILPEEPATLELGEKNGEDNKGKGSRKAPGNTPPPKPEFHRKMMYR